MLEGPRDRKYWKIETGRKEQGSVLHIRVPATSLPLGTRFFEAEADLRRILVPLMICFSKFLVLEGSGK